MNSNLPFGNIIFADPNDDPFFARLQKAKIGSEPNTSAENELKRALLAWTEDPSYASEKLAKFIDVITKYKDTYPSVFIPKTPIGTTVYRGVEELSDSTLDQLKQVPIDQWVKLTNSEFYFCKKPIKYVPRSPIQSWTTSESIARGFSLEGLLVTKQTNQFFMNQAIMKKLYSLASDFSEDEKEILHFGKSYNYNVYIAIKSSVFSNIKGKQDTKDTIKTKTIKATASKYL